ncbi:MAG: hypothetical protein Q9181_005340 [Wetmoreana brouardii]
MSNKYVDELRAIPEEKLSGIEADVEVWRYFHIPQPADEPHLHAYVDLVRDELDYAMAMEMPESDSKNHGCRKSSPQDD